MLIPIGDKVGAYQSIFVTSSIFCVYLHRNYWGNAQVQQN